MGTSSTTLTRLSRTRTSQQHASRGQTSSSQHSQHTARSAPKPARPVGEDSLHHIYHTCTAPAVVSAKDALRAALIDAIKELGGYTMHPANAAQAADLIMQRPDYYAGQISLDAYTLITAALAAAADAQQAPPGLPGETHPAAPRTGVLQQLVLCHSKRIHKIRMDAIPTQLRLTRYRKAMWANQRKAARAAARSRTSAAVATPAAAAAPAGAGQGGR